MVETSALDSGPMDAPAVTPQPEHTSGTPTDASNTIETAPVPWKLPNVEEKEDKEDKEEPTATSNSSVEVKGPTTNRTPLPFRIFAAFIALNLSIFLVALDTVIIPTALPTISQSFRIPDSLYAWTGSAYLLTNAASIPFWGKLSDIFGRKPVLLAANVVFLGGSIVCAVSISAPMLITGRSIQGLGGGGVVVLVHVCVSDLFSIRDRSFYMGMVGASWALASALGPVLGGVFAQELKWQWCFYINIPIVTFSIVVLYFTLDLRDLRTPLLKGLVSIDWLGTIAIITATFLLLVGLQIGSGSSYGRPLVISLIVTGSVIFMAFPFSQWWVGKRDGSPIMPLRIFKDISNLSALGVCACDALVFNSVAYFVPLYFQIVLERTPTVTGILMLAVAVPLALVSFGSGHFIEKTGRFIEPLQAGLFLMTLGVGLLITLNASFNLGKIIGILVLIGLGFGPNFGAPLIALQKRIQERDIATGTAAFGFVRMVSGAIGLVLGQVVFQHWEASSFDTLVSSGIPSDLAKMLVGGEAIAQGVQIRELNEAQKAVIHKSLTTSLRGTWILYTIVSALGLVISFGITRSKLRREPSPLTELEAGHSDTEQASVT